MKHTYSERTLFKIYMPNVKAWFCSVIFTIAAVVYSNLSQAQELLWAHPFPDNADYSDGASTATDGDGNVYIAGHFNGTRDFDPGSGVVNLTAGGQADIFIQKFNGSGQLLWAINIGGAGDELVTKMVTDVQGNIYVTGDFITAADFDPGPGVFMLDGSPGTDLFVLKLDPDGDFEWAYNSGPTGMNESALVADIDISSTGQVLVSGSFSGTVDFDPGSGVANLFSGVQQTGFLQMMNVDGTLDWVHTVGEFPMRVEGTAIDSDGAFYVTGGFTGSGDFDHGSGTLMHDAGNNEAGFVIRYRPSGDYDWSGAFAGAPGASRGYSAAIAPGQGVYLAGTFAGTVDFDPNGSGSQLVEPSGGYVVKIDSNGVNQWSKSTSGTGAVFIDHLESDAAGSVYAVGRLEGEADFDPNSGQSILASDSGQANPFLLKLASDGGHVWSGVLTSSDICHPGSFSLDSAGSVFITGFQEGVVDYDPGVVTVSGGNAGQSIHFVAKYENDLCSHYVNVDSLRDATCLDSGYISVSAANGISPYTYQWGTSPVTNSNELDFAIGGAYALTVTDSAGCIHKTSFVLNAPSFTNGFDLVQTLVNTTYRPGQQTQIWLTGRNLGCTPVSGDLMLDFTSLLHPVSYDLTPTSVVGNTASWAFANQTFDDAPITVHISLLVDTSAMIGDTICPMAMIAPDSGDIDTTNNRGEYCNPVRNSYDPNDKSVQPQGDCPQHFVELDQRLSYTVRFQNTGNAPAIDLYVLDTIDSGLDISTLRVLNQSHSPMITEVLAGNVIRFGFDSIMLADSGSNEPMSHGFVVFDIDPMANMQEGTVVTNSVGIYFDLNPPILTNEVFNTFVSVVPDCGPAFVAPIEDRSDVLMVYPNPAFDALFLSIGYPVSRAVITDMKGAQRTVSVINNRADVSALPSGLYVVTIEGEKGVHHAKFMVGQR